MNINETVIIPLIMSIVELVKGLGMPKKFSALVAVVVGTLLGVFVIEPNSIRTGLLKGIIYGLTASGLYSGTKNTYEQVKNNIDNGNKKNKCS